MKQECPVCDEEIEVPEKDGKRVECPECGAKLEVTNWDMTNGNSWK